MLPLQAVAELWALAFCRQRSDAAGGEGNGARTTVYDLMSNSQGERE